ncbi:MAG: FAD-dependent oxidoreductase [Chitinophagaceae bacterium]|nr:FAD-dependent oxidoreductase [Chitinophagaceae bacterium]
MYAIIIQSPAKNKPDSYRVKFWLKTEVTGFERNNGKITAVNTNQGKINCDELVIANGSWLGSISKMLGIKMLMQPGKGYSVVYNDLENNLQYPSILVDDRTATTPINKWLRIGGTMELSGHSDNILPKRVLAIYNAFKKYYPTMDLPEPDLKRAWFGYRPVSPDGMPYIGRHTKFSNLVYAGGHAMLGVSAAAGTGQLIKEIIGGEKPVIELTAFNPERFS